MNNGGNYCIWEVPTDDLSSAAMTVPAAPTQECIAIPVNYISGIVTFQSEPGAVSLVTNGSDDSYKAYESNIYTRTVDVPFKSSLTFGSYQDETDSGKANITHQMAIPPGQSLEEILRNMRISALMKKKGPNFGWPVHQSQVMYSSPGIPGDPIFLWEHCRQMKDRFTPYGEIALGTITNWGTDTTATVYVQLAFAECPGANGKWVPIGSIWPLAIAKNIATENELNSLAPSPAGRSFHARVRMPTGEEVMTIITFVAIVIGVSIIILVAAPELVALSAYASGWMLVGYTLSTAVGPSTASPEPDAPDDESDILIQNHGNPL